MNYGTTTKAGTAGAAGTLAYTGAETWIWVGVATAMIVFGVVSIVLAKRRERVERQVVA